MYKRNLADPWIQTKTNHDTSFWAFFVILRWLRDWTLLLSDIHYWLSLLWQAKVTVFNIGLKHLTTFLFCFVIDFRLLPVARDSNPKETNQNNSWNLTVLKPKYFEKFFLRCPEIFDCVLWVVNFCPKLLRHSLSCFRNEQSLFKWQSFNWDRRKVQS